MVEIRYLKDSDKKFWYSLDRHLPETEFKGKVRTKTGYVLLMNGKPAGLLSFGTIRRFAQCFLWLRHTADKVWGQGLCNIGKMI